MAVEADYFLVEPQSPAEPKPPLPESPPPYEPEPTLHRKADRIHDLLPRLLDSRNDPSWSALIGAIGEEDDRITRLIEEVRNQFFVKTANSPYLDRLAANYNLKRPKLVGIEDDEFRKYVPVMAYQPKQVRHIIDKLLELFFLKETTTAFLSSGRYAPFSITDGWDLQVKVDNVYLEQIKFYAADFYDVTHVSLDELIAAYNRQAKFSYAAAFFDGATGNKYFRIFTNTIGADGSLEIVGGLANIGLEFNGFISDAGTGNDTQWSVSKIGDSVTFQFIGGTDPGLNKLKEGDLFLCDIPGNQGSFRITAVDVPNNQFQFLNLFATTGNITQTELSRAKFLRPEKVSTFQSAQRALVWQTKPNQVTVEMPVTPSVIKRRLKGAFHLNGTTASITSIDSSTSLTLNEVSGFPSSGRFVIQPVNSITTRMAGTNDVVEYAMSGRLIADEIRYSYNQISGNTLLGIYPPLPKVTQLNEISLTAMSRLNHLVTCEGSHNFSAGEQVTINGSSGIPILTTTGTITVDSPILKTLGSIDGLSPGQLVNGTGIPSNTKIISILSADSVLMSNIATAGAVSASITFSENTNGCFTIASVSPSNFTFQLLGVDGTAAVAGTASVDRIGMANNGSTVILVSARPATDTKITGSYLWDKRAPFVLSSYTTTTTAPIVGGKTVKLLNVADGTIPNKEGFIVFDYGQNNQEGPIKYLYKPADNILALDPSYVFKQNHDVGSAVIAINHKGPHQLSDSGNEYPPYLTNPSAAREVLQELIRSVASAGVFIDFLIRYPSQLYGFLSVYE